MLDPQPTVTRNASLAECEAAQPDSPAGVLEQAVAATEEQAGPIGEAEMRALAEVARDCQHVRDVREVSTRLVAAMLRANYGRVKFSEDVFEAMSARIAETLVDAPTALPRMQRLWDQLRGEPR